MSHLISQFKSYLKIFSDPSQIHQQTAVEEEEKAVFDNGVVIEKMSEMNKLIQSTCKELQIKHPELEEVFKKHYLLNQLHSLDLTKEDDILKKIEGLQFLITILESQTSLEQLNKGLLILQQQNFEKDQMISRLNLELQKVQDNIQNFQTQVDKSRKTTLDFIA